MREILFKSKRIDNGEWVEGFVVRPFSRNAEGKITNYCFNALDEMGFVSECIVSADTICQYTGLTDKNGNKIWENDVLLQKTTEMHWCNWECVGVVKYGEHDWDESNYGYISIGFYVEPIVKKSDINKINCGINQDYINDECYPIEVIGNIFDNDELLKGE